MLVQLLKNALTEAEKRDDIGKYDELVSIVLQQNAIPVLLNTINELATLYSMVRTSDSFNPNLQGAENQAEQDAGKALLAIGALDTDYLLPIGAKAMIENDGRSSERYISFGQFRESENTDEYGVPDDSIFYYCFEGEESLKSRLNLSLTDSDQSALDIVKSYELVYFK